MAKNIDGVKELNKLVSVSGDSEHFYYSVFTKSIGSGKESRFTVWNGVFNATPIHKYDLIFCNSYQKDGKWFTLTGFTIL